MLNGYMPVETEPSTKIVTLAALVPAANVVI